MAFRPQDLCKTTRRVKGGARRRLFPRLLRDDRLMPRLGTAIRFFETKLGLRRCDLDAETLIHLFDEPKLARCLVACLARSYRYRSRRLVDVVGAGRAAALAARGLATPFDLRALAYARANAADGFVPMPDRARFLADLAPELDVAEAEQALWLDAPDQAVLLRVGHVPTPAEVRARYNLRLVETVLRAASMVHLTLRGDRASVEVVCARHDVPVELGETAVTLRGKQDALGVWTRHGARLARAALTLLSDGVLGPGEATVWLGAEGYDVRLDAAFLRDALPPRGWSAPAATCEALETLMEGLLAERRRGRLAGWRIQRWPDPLVGEQGAIWPEVALSRGMHSVALLPLTPAQLRAGAAALGALAERLAFVVLVPGAAPADLPAALTVRSLDDAGAATALADEVERVFPADGAEDVPPWLTDLAAAAQAAGSVADSELARRLDCAEEAVANRLAGVADAAAGVVYIDGFGLCAESFLDRARALLDAEMRRNDGRLDLGALGRRLRVLAGRNEGLHALIAHLSGALRPVA